MTTSLIPVERPELVYAHLKMMVLDSVTSSHSKRSYATALDYLFEFADGRPFNRALMMAWRSSMDHLSPSTINVRLSAARRMIHEARKNGMLAFEDAATLADVPNVRQAGTRQGNWLTSGQAKNLLRVPDRSTLRGKRDYAILATLVGCALRRSELAELNLETIQQREGRWVMIDLEGKGRRIRTVAIPPWVKVAIDEWTFAAGITSGRVFRKRNSESLSDWAIWSVVEHAGKKIGIEHFGAHDLRRTCAKLCRKSGGDLEQIQFMLGHSSIQTTERYLGSEQNLSQAVNDNLGL